ncbi:MAG: porphobilinogen synthase [Candidatus Marinimicrobia bacterium]|nr:porphobilinogen synthase [Candidatus Neomarinimicrobiota bacterium]|tara:strand:+ start:6476 stop:7462 length:987 start_codon:yes stop_codon:yes gene_type:complete
MNKNKFNLVLRPRRLRKNNVIRRIVRENFLAIDDLVYPLFVRNGIKLKSEISSMPGVYHFSPDSILKEVESLLKLGLDRIILFGIPDEKDKNGMNAISESGIIQQTIRDIKSRFPEMFIISDVCMCEYTNHGHCGIIENNEVNNDATLLFLQKQVISHAEAGVDMVAPSGMMDGMIGAIRKALDEYNFIDISIMSYAVKYASAFYGPFREAAESTPQFGDRRQYQMDPGNTREAIKEAKIDLKEGADILMVKPAMAYMDIIQQIKAVSFSPIAAYNVSGEYSMIKAASQKGWINGVKVRDELLLSIKRAGADIIISYFAKEYAKEFNN